MKQERRCLVCRSHRPQEDMLRWGIESGVAVLKERGRRGAYLCPTRACLSEAKSSHFSRAFRCALTLPESMMDYVCRVAHISILQTVSLARRQGVLGLGLDALKHDLSKQKIQNQGFSLGRQPRIVLIGTDLSARSKARLEEWGAIEFAPCEVLGRACGRGRVGVVWIQHDQLEKRLSLWVRAWQSAIGLKDELE